MKIAPFGVEQWMNEWETGAVTNLAETCVDSMTMEELLDISDASGTSGAREEIVERMMKLRLSYGDILGSDELLESIASMYGRAGRGNVMVMNGGSAANFISLYTMIEPGDEVVCAYPTYQQLYSIPESFGASVKLLRLRYENGFKPDVDELKGMISDRTKAICVNNSNNPTGTVMSQSELREIARAAESVNAWLYCDEAYRFMVHDQSAEIPSAFDLCERAVVTCGLSKCFSLAGLRLGWVVAPEGFINEAACRRDYTTISCGRLDDLLGCVAIKNRGRIFERNLSIVRGCAAMLDEWVNSERRIDYVKPEAGTTAFLRYDYEIGSEDFCRGLYRKDGTFLLPGACFGPEFDRYLRIGYAYSPDVLEEGLRRVSGFLRDLDEEAGPN
ncbi:MAG: aminotransferase class I/II-fold pyridoxal phosphate-dependent enzyme [Synergistaceae bacterium]|jgi:aspartate/methionine/tyrosine aminotransferase|nr:aminotransferase class I/II-fold pyridoxal phosphate-dependent enzyme [Synergistaceae bacterium]